MGLTAKTDSGATLWDGPYGGFMNWRNTIALAAVYSDHGDYQPEWDPEAWPDWVPLGRTIDERKEVIAWAPTAPAAPD